MSNKLTQNGSDVDMSASKAIVKALQPYTRYSTHMLMLAM